ncbi:hypothetical protein HDU86_000162 [Geranomyces michiganensis]|nr:hypothetical protein HDU86_000162 [Geranomyces michiganensis]
MPRLLPATLDIILVATLLAGLRRSGDFDFATDNVPSPALRWLLFQFLFVGERFLDVLLVLARKYPAVFRPRNPKLCPPSPPPLPPPPPPVQVTSPQSQPHQQLQVQQYSQHHPLPSPPPQRQRVVVAYQDYAPLPSLPTAYDVREPLPATTTYTYAIPQQEYSSGLRPVIHGGQYASHQHQPRAHLVPVAGARARRVVQQAWSSGVYGKEDDVVEEDVDYRMEYVGRRSAVDR